MRNCLSTAAPAPPSCWDVQPPGLEQVIRRAIKRRAEILQRSQRRAPISPQQTMHRGVAHPQALGQFLLVEACFFSEPVQRLGKPFGKVHGRQA